ncbi:hypothetical protein QAD02_010115 [Eretmocerus hayati]|uniref:Uncharacterized protein n=1 Tax=Eretmocerus hayati TaxID=131215 RepID=A0ACC2NBI3_9HYME|nr:hypothetical protein QAD02_010115 [Eretmocerus hayati]
MTVATEPAMVSVSREERQGVNLRKRSVSTVALEARRTACKNHARTHRAYCPVLGNPEARRQPPSLGAIIAAAPTALRATRANAPHRAPVPKTLSIAAEAHLAPDQAQALLTAALKAVAAVAIATIFHIAEMGRARVNSTRERRHRAMTRKTKLSIIKLVDLTYQKMGCSSKHRMDQQYFCFSPSTGK